MPCTSRAPLLRRQRQLTWSAAIVLLAMVGCTAEEPGALGGRPEPAAAGPTTEEAPTVIIRMTDALTFSPGTVEISAGQIIEWVVVGTMPHTVTDKPGSAGNPEHERLPPGATPFDSGLLEPGQRYRQTLTVPGEYTYLCLLHETGPMVGTIRVR